MALTVSESSDDFSASLSSAILAAPRANDTSMPGAVPLHSTPERSASCSAPEDDKYEAMGVVRKECTYVKT